MCSESRLAAEAEASAAALEAPLDWRDSKAGLVWEEALTAVDVAMAERRGMDALNALNRAQKLASTVPPPAERLTCVSHRPQLMNSRAVPHGYVTADYKLFRLKKHCDGLWSVAALLSGTSACVVA